MERTAPSGADRDADFDYYLPGMPALSTTPGRVERFVTTLFRRRGRRLIARVRPR